MASTPPAFEQLLQSLIQGNWQATWTANRAERNDDNTLALRVEGDSSASDQPLASHLFSPLETVLMAKADLETVIRVYEMYPPALTKAVFWNVCRCGGQPGVLGYLASKAPVLVKEQTEDGWYPIAMAMEQGRHDESDIRKMAELFPESLLSNLYWDRNPLKSCLRWKSYSKDLIHSLFNLSPLFRDQSMRLPSDVLEWNNGLEENGEEKDDDDVDDDDGVNRQGGIERRGEHEDGQLRRALDLDCALGMAPMVLRCRKFQNCCPTWTAQGFMECWRNILRSRNLQDVCTSIPATFVSDIIQGDTTLQYQWFQFQALNCGSLSLSCQIQYLDIWGGVEGPCATSLLRNCVVAMPRLVKFKVSVIVDLQTMAPIFLSLLQKPNATLKELEITAVTNPVGDIQPVLEALATNTSLETFIYKGEHGRDMSPYRGHLVRVLTSSNATLQSVELNCGGTMNCGASHDLLSFYTELNRFGRAKARHSDTTLPEFVELLLPVTTVDATATKTTKNDPSHKKACLEKLNITFGLLLESLKIWTAPWDPITQATSRTKRKATASSTVVDRRKGSHRAAGRGSFH